MEIDEGLTEPTDPVEETSPVQSTSADPIETSTEIIGTPPRSGEPTPIGTSSPIVMAGDGGSASNKGTQKDDLRDMEAESDEAEEKFSLAKEVLEPRGMEATPAVTSAPL